MKNTLPMTSIGLMSGTSVDGLDVCCATFDCHDGKWSFTIDCARGYEYPAELKRKLGAEVQKMSALEFVTFHSAYGRFLGQRVNDFMAQFGVRPDIIASHGSTVFHEPEKKVMYQIGDGATASPDDLICGGISPLDYRKVDGRAVKPVDPGQIAGAQNRNRPQT